MQSSQGRACTYAWEPTSQRAENYSWKRKKNKKTQWPLGILQLPCHRQSPPDSVIVSGTPALHTDSCDRDYEEWQASSGQPPTQCLTTHLPSLGISTSPEAEAQVLGYCVKPSMQLAPVAECDITQWMQLCFNPRQTRDSKKQALMEERPLAISRSWTASSQEYGWDPTAHNLLMLKPLEASWTHSPGKKHLPALKDVQNPC